MYYKLLERIERIGEESAWEIVYYMHMYFSPRVLRARAFGIKALQLFHLHRDSPFVFNNLHSFTYLLHRCEQKLRACCTKKESGRLETSIMTLVLRDRLLARGTRTFFFPSPEPNPKLDFTSTSSKGWKKKNRSERD